MSEPTIKGEIVKDILREFPLATTRTLAGMIYKNNKQVFSSAEEVRSVIRYYRMANGKRSREKVSTLEFKRDDAERFKENPYGLPDSEEMEFEPYVLPVGYKNILFLSDIHVPYHNIPSLTASLQYGKDCGVDCVWINGDLLDFYQLSSFEKDPRKRTVKYEIETTGEILNIIKRELGAKIYFKEGNHEYRLERYLRVKAPELLDVDEFRLDVLLKMGELGIEYITGKRIVHFGKLNVLHGHEIGRGGVPVNPARTLFLKTKENAIAGHWHQTSEHSEPSLNGKPTACWSVGCLCELHPEYAPINRWNHGFAHITIDDDRGFSVDNIRVYNGKIL